MKCVTIVKCLPNGGEQIESQNGEERFMNKFLLSLLTLVGVLGLVACGNDDEPETYEPYESSPDLVEYDSEAADVDDYDYEYDDEDEGATEDVQAEVEVNFNFTGFENMVSVELGMSIAAVHDFLGAPTSTMTMDLLGQESTTETWMGAFSFGPLPTTTIITFTDGYATSIMETADASSNVTLANYNEITVGMTESALYYLLSMPYSVLFADILGTRMVTVSWINADFTSITVTLMNGTVSSAMQIGL